jgi:hypothetical protein
MLLLPASAIGSLLYRHFAYGVVFIDIGNSCAYKNGGLGESTQAKFRFEGKYIKSSEVNNYINNAKSQKQCVSL